MTHESASDADVESLLKILGIESLCQWDVLVFLYRHQTTLVGADHLARLLGYAIDPLIDALDTLESLELVERSRVSQGARLYLFTAPGGSPRGEAFGRLMGLAAGRPGRLLLSRRLSRGSRSPQEGLLPARELPGEARQGRPLSSAARQRIGQRDEGRPKWLRVISF